MSKPYKLSALLYGHSLDVRAVVTKPDNAIISGSRDRTAKYWNANGFNVGYTDTITYKDQKNFVAAVLYINPSNEYPDGLIVTGGNDNVILIYKPHEPFATFTIKEHTNAVCCLSNGLEAGTFFSGSWDSTAKCWTIVKPTTSLVTYAGHSAAIWSVIQMGNGNVATASADKTINIWSREGERMKVLTGHTDCVRGLADFPDLNHFLSVSNDASIKVWTYSGENLSTLYGHTNYIYSIARNKSDGENSFVTSDEDRTVRYWKDGVNIQTFTLPAQSIWSVACLNNGDIVTGSSDGVLRIFTQDESRYASEEALKQYEESVEALQKQTCQEIGGYKVSDLPGKEALYDPGKHAGQMKMIREGGGVVAYTWVESDENSHWEKVGDVLGANDKANEGKTMYEGKSYDFVFTVDVEDGKPPLKLPYNRGEDAYTAANKFLSKNNLPSTYLDQVVEFIFKNSQGSTPMQVDNNYVDPFTGASRYTPGSNQSEITNVGRNFDPFTGGSSYSTSQTNTHIPASSQSSSSSGTNMDPFTGGSSYSTQQNPGKQTFFPQSSYIRFDMGDPQVILNKLKEFNQKIGDGANRLEEAVIDKIGKMCVEPCQDITILDDLFGLLQWPDDKVFPVIDVIRLGVRNEVNNNLIALKDNGAVLNKLKTCIGKNCQVPNNVIVGLRALSNLFLYPSGEELIFMNRVELLETVTSLTANNKNIQIGLATLLLNLSILTLKRKDEVGVILLGSVLPDIMLNISDPEGQFRALVALGTLIMINDSDLKRELKAKVMENGMFLKKLQELSSLYGTDLEMKRMKCASQVQDELLH